MPTHRSGRLGSAKSRTGCMTCKVRRVKCGEEKPVCHRCSSTGRRCEYDASLVSLDPTSVRASSAAGQRERRAFEYYFHHAAPALSGMLDGVFWRGAVLQICRSEPAIWDAIIALSALYERPPITDGAPFRLLAVAPPAVRFPRHREALGWYARSLRALQVRRGLAPAAALVSCVLFIAIEILQGNMAAAVALYRQGVQLVARESSLTRLPSDLRGLTASVFTRLGTLTVVLAGVAPMSTAPVAHPDGFPTLDGARTALYALITKWKLLNEDVKQGLASSQSCADLLLRQQSLESQLLSWHGDFQRMRLVQQSPTSPTRTSTLSSSSTAPTPHHKVTPYTGLINTLLMTYTSILIETRTSLRTHESAYTAHEPSFREILRRAPAALAATTLADDGAQPPFTFEMGVGLALFITALKCRRPARRRDALRFLCAAPQVQSLYMCRPTAQILAAIVSLEEDPAGCQGGSLERVLAAEGVDPKDEALVREFEVVSEGERTWVVCRMGEGSVRRVLVEEDC